ncbi:MAG TPA: MASE3 domain-containing protein [Rhodocyclaceae bacterium]|nr:MASE3 domain-containing protein [Rhodocyclaceae bacterium]
MSQRQPSTAAESPAAAASSWPHFWIVALSLVLMAGWLIPAGTKVFSDARDYLPWHTGLEFASMAVFAMVTALGWNLKDAGRNNHTVLLAAVFLYTGLADFAHTLSFRGMPDWVTPAGPEKAINFWLAERLGPLLGLYGLALLPAGHWSRLRCLATVAAGLAAAILVGWIGLYHADRLPRTFIPGTGLTTFKVATEYVLSAAYFGAALLLYRRALREESGIHKWLAAAAWILALAGLCFTLYVDVTDAFNILGHVYQTVAAWIIYRALFAAGVQAPFRALKEEEARLEQLVGERTAELRDALIQSHRLTDSLQVSEDRLRLGLRCARMNMFEYDPVSGVAHREGYINEVLGLPSETTGAEFMAQLHPDDRPRFVALCEGVCRERPNYVFDYRFRLADGSYRWLADHAEALFDAEGKPVRLLGVCSDISERKQAEMEIQRLNADLERRVEERTAQLQASNKELQSFTYAASHDMKGPLGRINAFSTLLEKHYGELLTGDGRMFLDLIRRNASRLTVLIDDLLDHAQIEQRALDVQPVDLAGAVQGVLNEKEDDIREAGAEVKVHLPDVPITVRAHPHGLSQVLRNLVENALKYSAEATPPSIDIGAEVEGAHCRLWVRDNGIGFDMAYHDSIFEIFRRLHTYEEFSGSGVGLAIVRKAVDRMGGRVWAESSPGRGAAFFVELPVWVEAPSPITL